MALAKKCDRCGKFHDHYEHNILGINANAVTLIRINDVNNHITSSQMYNLCPQCLEDFETFIYEEDYNNESISE